MPAAIPITVVAPQLPPAVCGVGDYTMRLMEAWNDFPRFRFCVARGQAESAAMRPDLRISTFGCTRAGLSGVLAATADSHVLLEYVPHGYDRKGCPQWISGAVRDWQKVRRGSAKMVVMFHELWVRLPWWRPAALRQVLHRWSIRRLIRAADCVFTNTAGYAQWIRSLTPDRDVQVAPIGSTVVPVSPNTSVSREAGLFVLFGRQGTRVHALRSMGASLARLHVSGRLRTLIIAGGGGGQDAQERRVLGESGLPGEVISHRGFMPADELSALLHRAEFGVSDQTWDSVSKSTTFMAYASHGLNIVSPFAGRDFRPPFDLLTSTAELESSKSAATEDALKGRSRQLVSWYRETADWPMIVRKMRTVFDDN